MKQAQEKEVDVAEIRISRCISGVTKLDRIRNERIIRGTEKAGEMSKKGTGKQVEVVWACIEKRIRTRRQESDGDGGAGE